MEDEVLFERRGSLGIATLNRPRALNALTETMVVLLFAQYSQWDADPTISAILLRGAGGKAFCAGGDVKAAASAVAGGRPEAAFAFFRSEYRLNHLISKLKKPHVALIDGIVMGGGAGLSVHGRYRVATEATTFAMPECAIGLFPDVGTTFFLPRACGPGVARWLALTGARLTGGEEVVGSGVGTHFVRRERLPELVEALAALESPSSSDSVSSSSSSSLCVSSSFPSWVPSWLLRMMPKRKKKARCPVAAVLSRLEEKRSSSSSSSFAAFLSKDVERLFGKASCSSLEELREAVSRELAARRSSSEAPAWLRSAAAALEAECPQSQALSWALLEASTTTTKDSGSGSGSSSSKKGGGITAFSLADTLRLEWRILSRVSLASPDSDFVEGVAARLLSKPARAARWRGDGSERAAREVVSRPLAEELELEAGGATAAAAVLQSRL